MSELQSSVASAVGAAHGAPVPQSATLVARWYVLIMMCLVYTLSIADRYVVSTVLDPIRIELHLTDKGVALLTGVAFGLFYVILGFPAVVAHRPLQPPQDRRRVPGAVVGDDRGVRAGAHLAAVLPRPRRGHGR